MIKYSNFLFSILIKKIGLYITFVVFCAAFFGIFIAGYQNNPAEQLLFPISTFTKWFPFVFSTIFILIASIRIFKTGEQDGTELLISSKPLSRTQIIFARFFVLLVLIIVFQTLSFGFYILVSQVDTNATGQEKLKFAATMALGGAITSLLLMAIIIIVSSIMGRIGTLVIGILFATSIPIVSFIIVPFANATSPVDKYLDHKTYNYLSPTRKDADSIYDPSIQETNLAHLNFWDPGDKKRFEENKKSWYHQAKYGDVWYQWNRFYSLLEPKVFKTSSDNDFAIKSVSYNQVYESEFKRMMEEAKQITVNSYMMNASESYGEFTIQLVNRFIAFFSKDEIDFEKNHMASFFQKYGKDKYKNLTKFKGSLWTELNGKRTQFDEWRDENSIAILASSKKRLIYNEKRENKLQYLMSNLFFGRNVNIKSKYYRILLWRAINDFQNNNDDISRYSKQERTAGDLSRRLNFFDNSIYQYYFDSRNLASVGRWSSKINTKSFGGERADDINFEAFSKNYFVTTNAKLENFLDQDPIIIFWSGIGVFLLGTSILIYFRRDFR